MSERIPFKVKLAATVLPVLGVAAAACGNGGKDQVTATTAGTAGASTVRPEATISAVISPTAIRTAESTPTSVRTSTTVPTAVPTSAPTGENTDMAVRFGEAVGLENNWLEVPNPESLIGLKEFTFMARVRLRSGVGAQFVDSDAVASLGKDIELIGIFTSLASNPVFNRCPGLAVVIDDDPSCSGITLPRDRFVTFGVTFKDKELRFIVGDTVSAPIKTKDSIPNARAPFYIGASPKGADEGFSGEIDDIVILKEALSPDQVKAAIAVIEANNTRALLDNNGKVLALWTFDRNDGYKDVSGKGNNAFPIGEVSLVEVK